MNMFLGIIDIYVGGTLPPSSGFNLGNLFNTIVGSAFGAAAGFGTAYSMFVRNQRAAKDARDLEKMNSKKETYSYLNVLLQHIPTLIDGQIEQCEKFIKEYKLGDFSPKLPALVINSVLNKLCEIGNSKDSLHSFLAFYPEKQDAFKDYAYLFSTLEYENKILKLILDDVTMYPGTRKQLLRDLNRSFSGDLEQKIIDLCHNQDWIKNNKIEFELLNEIYGVYFKKWREGNIDIPDMLNLIMKPIFEKTRPIVTKSAELKEIIKQARVTEGLYFEIIYLNNSLRDRANYTLTTLEVGKNELFTIIENVRKAAKSTIIVE